MIDENKNILIEVLKLKTILEEKKKDSDPRPFKLVKQFYDSCMNTDILEEKGLKPLQDLLSKLGGWPVVEGNKWNDEDFKWYKLAYKSREEGSLTTFHSVNVEPDYKVYFSIKTNIFVFSSPEFQKEIIVFGRK